MSLKLISPSGNPLGQYDGLDSEVLTLKGGEVVTFATVAALSSVDLAAQDQFADGYVFANKRVVVTKTLTSASRPLMLADDGIVGYGTLLGAVVGGTVGQQMNGPNSYTGAVLGPHTATGSGKVTCWSLPGTFGVSLDACDTNAVTGLQPTNVSLTAGAALTYSTAGILTPVGSPAASGATVVGRFIEFETNGSLVNTPSNLVGTLTTPDGALSSTAAARTFKFAVFAFNPAN